MTVTRKRIYFASTSADSDLRGFVRSRLEYRRRFRELGYDVVDPYRPFVEALEAELPAAGTSADSEELGAVAERAVERAAAEDPFFALVRRQSMALREVDRLAVLGRLPAEQAEPILELDRKRVGECDLLVADLPPAPAVWLPEVECARELGLLRYAVSGSPPEGEDDPFTATFPTLEKLAAVLEAHNSGERLYLTTSPVNKVRGEVLIYAIDLTTLFPHILVQVAEGLGHPRRLFSFCCERSHVHELAQKIPVMLRLGGVAGVTVLTKDGSPHDVQMHTMVQEVVDNVRFRGPVRHLVVEHGVLHQVSAAAVKASRHLHATESYLAAGGGPSEAREARPARVAPPCVGLLVGGQSDLPVLERSGLRSLLDKENIQHTFDVISSDRDPERLREHCRANADRWDLVIAAAGGVPNLPITVKAWLPGTPVISVPVEESVELAAASLTTPPDCPTIVAGYGERGLRKAGLLAIQLLSWRAANAD